MRHQLQVAAAGDAAVVSVGAESLCESHVSTTGEELLRLAGERPRLRLDFSEVDYLNSRAVAKLVSVYRRAKGGGGSLTLENVGAPVYEILEITGLTGLLDVQRLT
jgi:anti-anti-sigma factor